MGALDLDLIEFLVFDLEVLSLPDLVAAAGIFLGDRLARLRVDHLLLETIARVLVDAMKRNALGSRRSRIKRDRARDQRELEITLPIRSRRHGELLAAYARVTPGIANMQAPAVGNRGHRTCAKDPWCPAFRQC